MPYRYLEDIATADAAFEAWGKRLEDMFIAAADATMNVMVGDLNSIANHQQMSIRLEDDQIDMLLFNFLQELIFYKDAQRLLLRADKVDIQQDGNHFTLNAQTHGEKADHTKHDLIVDIKAITLHHFKVEKTRQGYKASVIVDI